MSRIIAGKFRGRRLKVPTGKNVRPTTDRMRERLFSMLTHGRYPPMQDARVADIFAGTGALGLEALSRGAAHTTFVENSRETLACLRRNIDSLGVHQETKIIATKATTLPPADRAYDFIFMDPPYRKNLLSPAFASLRSRNWLKDETVIVCELASDEQLDLPEDATIVDERSQGQQRLLILNLTAANAG